MNINKKMSALLLSLLFCLPLVVYSASGHMPKSALIIIFFVYLSPIIILTVIIKSFFYKWLFKLDKSKEVYYSLVANFAPLVVVGIFLEFIGSLLYFLYSYFIYFYEMKPMVAYILAIVLVTIVGAISSSLLELIVIQLVWKRRITKRNFKLTFYVNLIPVLVIMICIFTLYI